jgi:hypothetical protein
MTRRWRAALAAFLLLTVVSSGRTATTASLGDDPSTFDQQMDTAMLKKNVAFIAAVAADDMRFTHYGGNLVWNKQAWLDATRIYKGLARNVDSVEVERHGDVVETTGHLQVKTPSLERPEYQIYFVRLYVRRATGWQFLSHRTMRQVEGPLPAK